MKSSTILLLALLFLSACSKDSDATTNSGAQINEGNDPNFKIVVNSDSELSNFNRKVVVFGVDVYAASSVEDSKLLHAANLMAQYLDNDEDGSVDNQLVLDKMIENKAFLFMWKTEADMPSGPPSERLGQDLGNDETVINFVNGGKTGQFDAGLEEVLHIITHAGYAQAYPTIFGENIGSELANAMDIARGGQFTTIPNPYPASAWYTYDDQTCDYSCMSTEYIYWALTSILGTQENRLDEIGQEWKLNTKSLVENQDEGVYRLLTNPTYNFPTVLPDGTYMR